MMVTAGSPWFPRPRSDAEAGERLGSAPVIFAKEQEEADLQAADAAPTDGKA